MPAGRSPLPGPPGLCGEPGPGGVRERRNSLGKALGSVLLPRAGASPLRVAAAWYLPAGSSMITAGTLPSSALRRRRLLHGIMCGPF